MSAVRHAAAGPGAANCVVSGQGQSRVSFFELSSMQDNDSVLPYVPIVPIDAWRSEATAMGWPEEKIPLDGDIKCDVIFVGHEVIVYRVQISGMLLRTTREESFDGIARANAEQKRAGLLVDPVFPTDGKHI